MGARDRAPEQRGAGRDAAERRTARPAVGVLEDETIAVLVNVDLQSPRPVQLRHRRARRVSVPRGMPAVHSWATLFVAIMCTLCTLNRSTSTNKFHTVQLSGCGSIWIALRQTALRHRPSNRLVVHGSSTAATYALRQRQDTVESRSSLSSRFVYGRRRVVRRVLRLLTGWAPVARAHPHRRSQFTLGRLTHPLFLHMNVKRSTSPFVLHVGDRLLDLSHRLSFAPTKWRRSTDAESLSATLTPHCYQLSRHGGAVLQFRNGVPLPAATLLLLAYSGTRLPGDLRRYQCLLASSFRNGKLAALYHDGSFGFPARSYVLDILRSYARAPARSVHVA